MNHTHDKKCGKSSNMKIYLYEKDANNNNEPEQTTLLNQGTYGCVFRPGIECSSKQLTSKKIYNKNPEIQGNVHA